MLEFSEGVLSLSHERMYGGSGYQVAAEGKLWQSLVI